MPRMTANFRGCPLNYNARETRKHVVSNALGSIFASAADVVRRILFWLSCRSKPNQCVRAIRKQHLVELFARNIMSHSFECLPSNLSLVGAHR